MNKFIRNLMRDVLLGGITVLMYAILFAILLYKFYQHIIG
jgi:hypothetical protein